MNKNLVHWINHYVNKRKFLNKIHKERNRQSKGRINQEVIQHLMLMQMLKVWNNYFYFVFIYFISYYFPEFISDRRDAY